MKYVSVIIFLFFILTSCTPEKDSKEDSDREIEEGLKTGESVSVESNDYGYAYKKVVIYVKRDNEKKVLCEKKTNMVNPRLHIDGNDVYFIVNNELDKTKLASRELWKFDGDTGNCFSLGIKVYHSVEFSDDSRYILYHFANDDNAVKFPDMILYSPVLRLYDLHEKKLLKEYNLEGELYSEGTVCSAYIDYDKILKGFDVCFSQDGPTCNIGKIFISTDTFDYEILEKGDK